MTDEYTPQAEAFIQRIKAYPLGTYMTIEINTILLRNMQEISFLTVLDEVVWKFFITFADTIKYFTTKETKI